MQFGNTCCSRISTFWAISGGANWFIWLRLHFFIQLDTWEELNLLVIWHSTRCAHCLPFFWFLNSWDEEAEKVMGMSVFSEFFYWFRVALFFSAGTKIIAGIILLSVSATLFLSPSLRVCFFFSLCSAFFFLCSSSGFWVYFSPPSVLGFLLPFIDSPTDCL